MPGMGPKEPGKLSIQYLAQEEGRIILTISIQPASVAIEIKLLNHQELCDPSTGVSERHTLGVGKSKSEGLTLLRWSDRRRLRLYRWPVGKYHRGGHRC